MANKTPYREEFIEQARKLCLLLGATDVQLANFFGTTDRTIRTWKKKHAAFAEAVAAGKELADMGVVQSLYNRALAGDTVACIFILKNRHPAQWRDRAQVEHSGVDGAPIAVKNTVDVSGLNEDQLRVLAGLRIGE